jgi:GH25 family lysozyme M1 (1,4-beta-N-acetylmuramidase)
MILGLDYASVDENARPDLEAACAAGVRFAIVRASYSTLPDPTCTRDRDAIRAAGLVFGAYTFPVTNVNAPDPEEQIETYIASAGLIPGCDLPPVLDLEWPHGIAATGRTPAGNVAWIGRAVAAIQQATGVAPIIYSSARVLDGTDTDALGGAADTVIAGCPAWCARYAFRGRIPAVLQEAAVHPPPVPRALGDADAWWIHQYQGDAVQMPGFSSTVDLDRFNPLCRGAHGTRVLWAQRRLGLAEGTPGTWDDVMDDAVRSFQAAHGLVADGVIGPATFAALAWVHTENQPG